MLSLLAFSDAMEGALATISASFSNGYSSSRRFVIADTGIDPNSPLTIFDGYLDINQTTDPLALYSSDGIYGQAAYQRSDGAVTIVADITDGSTVAME
jgi:hypothetical protein